MATRKIDKITFDVDFDSLKVTEVIQMRIFGVR